VGNLLLSKSRIAILFTVILGVLTIFAAQLVRVQVIQASEYQLKATTEMQSTRVIQAPRGEITDVNGIAFARSVSATRLICATEPEVDGACTHACMFAEAGTRRAPGE
jgi:cell division protein FtsI (penicillin-binding protein 3)